MTLCNFLCSSCPVALRCNLVHVSWRTKMCDHLSVVQISTTQQDCSMRRQTSSDCSCLALFGCDSRDPKNAPSADHTPCAIYTSVHSLTASESHVKIDLRHTHAEAESLCYAISLGGTPKGV
eukprot:6482682-Amphidinium_carterae.1